MELLQRELSRSITERDAALADREEETQIADKMRAELIELSEKSSIDRIAIEKSKGENTLRFERQNGDGEAQLREEASKLQR